MSHREPPVKRRLVENDDGSHSHAVAPHNAHSAQAARQTFLSALDAFASDSDSEGESSPSHASLAKTAAPAPEKVSSFFSSTQDQRGDSTVDGASQKPVVSTLVGRDLLHQMFREKQAQDKSEDGGLKRASHATLPASMPRVVEAYVPLSTGGFLDTTEETINLRHLKVGAILYHKPAFVPTKTNAQTTTSPSASVTAASTYANGAGRGSAPVATAPTTTVARTPSVATLSRFKKQSALSEEAQLYGKELTPDVAEHLFEVSRVDLAQQVVEALFLDGTRRKLRASEVRTAGFVESKLFIKWKADPSSRPVQRVVLPADPHTPAHTAGGEGGVLEAAPAATWWVLPNLIVRVVAEAAGEKWFGKKCAVESIRRKENKVRLRLVVGEAAGGAHTLSTSPADVLEIIGLDGVETVVPKKGGQGILVSGAHRGEIVLVRNRVRDGVSGDLTGIEVASTLEENEKDVFEVLPSELCEMRRV